MCSVSFISLIPASLLPKWHHLSVRAGGWGEEQRTRLAADNHRECEKKKYHVQT